MECDDVREALSARLDGEDEPTERPGVDAHLSGCLPCRRWHDAAIEVTRLVRVAPIGPVRPLDVAALTAPADPGPAGPAHPRRRRLVGVLRAALGLVGTAQFALGMAQVAGGAATTQAHTGAQVSPGHLWHESAAWNIAIGAGFVWIAMRRARPGGALPMLTAFVGVLGLLSVEDFTAGRVDQMRLLSHGLVLAGYLVTLALSRPALDPGRPPAGRSLPPGIRTGRRAGPVGVPAAPPRLRLIQGQAKADPGRQRRRAA